MYGWYEAQASSATDPANTQQLGPSFPPCSTLAALAKAVATDMKVSGVRITSMRWMMAGTGGINVRSISILSDKITPGSGQT